MISLYIDIGFQLKLFLMRILALKSFIFQALAQYIRLLLWLNKSTELFLGLLLGFSYVFWRWLHNL